MGKNCVQLVNTASTSLWSSAAMVGKLTVAQNNPRVQVDLYTQLCALYQQLFTQPELNVLISKIPVIHLVHRHLLLGRVLLKRINL